MTTNTTLDRWLAEQKLERELAAERRAAARKA
jgi:hypothetical protein